jgi:alkylhydroperoxidase family enzyme
VAAWIRTVDEDDAEGLLQRLYSTLLDPGSGKVDHILKIHGLHPEGLRAHLSLYRTVMTGTPGLPKADRELIAWSVSRTNECHY